MPCFLFGVTVSKLEIDHVWQKQRRQTHVPTNGTVDGRNPANQLRFVAYPIVYRVLYIPGGAGLLPSTVSSKFDPKMDTLNAQYRKKGVVPFFGNMAVFGERPNQDTV